MIRGEQAGEKHTHRHTHAARINRAAAKELHCRILIAEKTSHEEEVCVCKKRGGGGEGVSPLKHTHELIILDAAPSVQRTDKENKLAGKLMKFSV